MCSIRSGLHESSKPVVSTKAANLKGWSYLSMDRMTCPIFFLRCHCSDRFSRCSNTDDVISPYATFFTS